MIWWLVGVSQAASDERIHLFFQFFVVSDHLSR